MSEINIHKLALSLSEEQKHAMYVLDEVKDFGRDYIAERITRGAAILAELDLMIATSDAATAAAAVGPEISIPISTEIYAQPIVVNMYFDKYERHCGDGFYPQLNRGSLCSSTDISFMLTMKFNKNVWRQIDNGCINGLDGNCGVELLDYLNQYVAQNYQAKQILSTNGMTLYPKER